MKSIVRIFLFSKLDFLWLSASQCAARQRVTIDRVLGVEGGQIEHGGFVAQIRGAFLKTIVSWSLFPLNSIGNDRTCDHSLGSAPLIRSDQPPPPVN